jgi:hypothetical protein
MTFIAENPRSVVAVDTGIVKIRRINLSIRYLSDFPVSINPRHNSAMEDNFFFFFISDH